MQSKQIHKCCQVLRNGRISEKTVVNLRLGIEDLQYTAIHGVIIVHLDGMCPPGVTYMLGNVKDDGVNEIKPFGLPGYYLEGGLAHLFKQRHKVLHYFDYGVGLKHYGGAEKYVNTSEVATRGTFNFWIGLCANRYSLRLATFKVELD